MDLENLSESDAQTIASDETNEFHEQLYSGDSAVKTAVERAFSRGAQSQPAEPAVLTNAPEAELDPELKRLKENYESQAGVEGEPAAHDNPLGEISPAETQVTQQFRNELAGAYEGFIQDGARGLQKLFPNQQQAAAAIRQSGILDDAEALAQGMRLLAKLGGKARR